MDAETKKALVDILQAVQALDSGVARMESGGTSSEPMQTDQPRTAQRRLSIKEFLLEHRPVDDVQKTLAIGYFLEMNEGMESFNKSDLEKGYRAAKEQVPSNINDKVNMSIKNGHMMEAEGKKDSMKAWVLTSTGEQYVQNGYKKVIHGK